MAFQGRDQHPDGDICSGHPAVTEATSDLQTIVCYSMSSPSTRERRWRGIGAAPDHSKTTAIPCTDDRLFQ